MPKAKLKNIDVIKVSKCRSTKWSPKNIWLGYWLGPIVTLYELTIEDGQDVLIEGGDCIEIIFNNKLDQ